MPTFRVSKVASTFLTFEGQRLLDEAGRLGIELELDVLLPTISTRRNAGDMEQLSRDVTCGFKECKGQGRVERAARRARPIYAHQF